MRSASRQRANEGSPTYLHRLNRASLRLARLSRYLTAGRDLATSRFSGGNAALTPGLPPGGASSLGSMRPIIMNRGFIAHSTKMLHFPARLSTSASSHHDLSLAAFITNIAESDFRYTQPARQPPPDIKPREYEPHELGSVEFAAIGQKCPAGSPADSGRGVLPVGGRKSHD
jgi:hypothetical protein